MQAPQADRQDTFPEKQQISGKRVKLLSARRVQRAALSSWAQGGMSNILRTPFHAQRKNGASRTTLRCRFPFPSEEPLRPRTNPMRARSSTQKRFSEGNRPRHHNPLRKGSFRKNDGSRAVKHIFQNPNGAPDHIRPKRIDGAYPSFRICLLGGIL